MRKIEEDMLDAIKNKVSTKLGNTEVHYAEYLDGCIVTLYDTYIAGIYKDEINIFDCGNYSIPTKSRLNAVLSLIGMSVVQHGKNKWFYRTESGVEFDFKTITFSNIKLPKQ